MRPIFCVLAVVMVVACADHRTYPSRTFTWNGDITPGAAVKIRNIDGSIAVLPSSTNKLTVEAVIVNAAPNAVSVEQAASGNDLAFCTRLGSRSRGACGADDHSGNTTFSPWSLFSRNHPITVLYTVHIPTGVRLDAETVNGRIAAQNVGGNVKAETVNGDVVVSTINGTVNAESVNGSIIASMAAVPDSGDIHLETVNGSITSVIPEGIGGTLILDNTNGKVSANYPNAEPDSSSPHHLRIKLGDGNRRVNIESVNGSVSVTKYVKTPVVSLQN